MRMKDSSDNTGTTNPLAQLRVARRKPVAALLGATAGLVPVGVFELGHYELTSWSPLDCPKAVIVYAGLLFSALTVLGWSSDMFGSRVKAIGFTALLEGIMMTADAGWLSGIALCYLVVINAVANGCRLAMRDATLRGLDVEPGAQHRRRRGGYGDAEPEAGPRSWTAARTPEHDQAEADRGTGVAARKHPSRRRARKVESRCRSADSFRGISR
jgi:hypothetical protein